MSADPVVAFYDTQGGVALFLWYSGSHTGLDKWERGKSYSYFTLFIGVILNITLFVLTGAYILMEATGLAPGARLELQS